MARAAATPPQQPDQGEKSVHSKYLVLLIVLLGACGRGRPVTVPAPAQFPPQAGQAEVDVDGLISSMSVRDKVAQLVMPWIPGNYAAFDDETFRRMQAWV